MAGIVIWRQRDKPLPLLAVEQPATCYVSVRNLAKSTKGYLLIGLVLSSSEAAIPWKSSSAVSIWNMQLSMHSDTSC